MVLFNRDQHGKDFTNVITVKIDLFHLQDHSS